MRRGALLLALIAYVGFANAQQLDDALRLFDEANGLVESGPTQKQLASTTLFWKPDLRAVPCTITLPVHTSVLDKIGEAVRYYERARRLLGDDPQLLHNIQIVEAQVQNPFLRAPYTILAGLVGHFVQPIQCSEVPNHRSGVLLDCLPVVRSLHLVTDAQQLAQACTAQERWELACYFF